MPVKDVYSLGITRRRGEHLLDGAGGTGASYPESEQLMTGGKDQGSGTWVEHKGVPPRTKKGHVHRRERPTLPDGIAAEPLVQNWTVAVLSGGTFDVPLPRLELAEEADQGDEPTRRMPSWSGELAGEADELVATPRVFNANPSLEASAVEVEPHAKSESDPDSLEASQSSAQPVSVDPAEISSDTSDLDSELEQLFALHGTPDAEQLYDAVDEDETNPEVPLARRRSERPGLVTPEPLAVVESVAPPPVSVTVPPPEWVDEVDSHSADSRREMWWTAAAVVGVAAAAAAFVLMAGDLTGSSEREQAATKANRYTSVATGARPVDDQPAAPEAEAPEAEAPEAEASKAKALNVEAKANESEPVARDAARRLRRPRLTSPEAVPSPLAVDASDASVPLAERMRRAVGEEYQGTRPNQKLPREATPTPTSPPGDDAPVKVSFDRVAANAALQSAARRAAACRQPGEPSGQAQVSVTFSPSSGRATQATIGGRPFQGTPTGACIVGMMRQATVPPFAGDYMTVRKTIVVQ